MSLNLQIALALGYKFVHKQSGHGSIYWNDDNNLSHLIQTIDPDDVSISSNWYRDANDYEYIIKHLIDDGKFIDYEKIIKQLSPFMTFSFKFEE